MNSDYEIDESSIIFRDVVTLALLGIVAIVIILLAHINPKGKKDASEIRSPGNIIVEVFWPPEFDHDVDLWVKAPGDRPVGYSHKAGVVFNLLRDDLGHRGDPSDINMESAYTRTAPDGEYIVNLHFYRINGDVPIPVKTIISHKASAKESAKPIVTREIELSGKGEEATVLRFNVKNNKIIKDSFNTIPIKIRSGLWNTRGDNEL